MCCCLFITFIVVFFSCPNVSSSLTTDKFDISLLLKTSSSRFRYARTSRVSLMLRASCRLIAKQS